MKIWNTVIILLGAMILLYASACSPKQIPIVENQRIDKPYYPYETQFVELADGTRMAYREEGKGEHTLLMVHGLGSYLPAWDKIRASLAPDFRCIAIDLPGYGNSELKDHPVSIAFFAKQIESFIKALKLKNLSLVGHSMGGQISLRIALNGKTDLDQLILLAPAGIETFDEKEAGVLKKLFTPQAIYALSDAQIEQSFNLNFYGNKLPEDAQFMLKDRLELKTHKTEYEAFSKLFSESMQAMLEGPVFNELSALKLPVLILFGEDDQLIPSRFIHPGQTTLEIAERAKSAIPDSELQMIPDCGHFVPWEKAQWVSNAIIKFSKRHVDQ